MDLGRIAHDAFFAASNLPCRQRFDELRPSARRLWDSAAIAAVHAGAIADERLGHAAYTAYMVETGLPLSHFPTWTDMARATQLQWIAAALAARAETKQ